jgi:hypothetical protein
MRILRFNESSKRYPKKVTQKEFFDKKGIHKMISFTQTERTTMSNILTEKQKKYEFNPIYSDKDIRWSKLYGYDEGTSSEFIEIHYLGEFFEIVKLDDDWFTIIHDLYGSSIEYYICDEFEEVVNFLTDLGNFTYFN